jgi:AraC-like DNA-binding protein
MSRDTLSNLLRAIRLRGAIFYHLDAVAPWVAEAPPGAEIIPAILPGVEHLMEFHGVARGSCWAGIVGEEPIRLDTGDLVIFPRGDAHVISSEPGLRAERVDLGVYYAPRPSQLPYALRVSERGAAGSAPGRDEPEATIMCGFIGCDARPFNPLLAALPRMLRVPGRGDGGSPWLADLLHAVVQESIQKRPGGEAVLERMTEMMFVEALRRYVDALPAGETGWLAGMGDTAVGRALALLHERPGEAWTLERLGEAAAVSRSTLHERFIHFLGQPPMQYLAQWRMQLAACWLRDTDAKVLEVALEVGYENETAFARAFRRATGESPGAWRRARRERSGRREGGGPPPPPSRPPRATA